MKKKLILFMVVMLTFFCMTACSSDSDTKKDSTKSSDNSKIKVVTTIFPEYDWVKQILGEKEDNADLTMLLDNGVDLHSYQPTAEDIMKISDCDVFIYVGGESDKWVDDTLKQATNKNMIVINLLDVLGNSVREEEAVEGMQQEKEDESGDAKEAPELDEHVWLSLKNAVVLCNAINDALCKADTKNSDTYKANTAKYIDQLKKLDVEYKDTVDLAKYKTLLFGDRFPFRYLVDDYGLSYYAAFVGCSAETEASFETITFLAGKVDEIGLHSILTIESSDQKIAKTIIENTKNKDQKILSMDSMQSVTSENVKNNTTYLSIMTKNLSVLKEALDSGRN